MEKHIERHIRHAILFKKYKHGFCFLEKADNTAATSPVGIVDFSMRLQHSISYYDEASAHSNAKPAGVHGWEIFMKVDGEAPKDVSELTYVATNTASPYVVKFDGNKVGKTVYYWLRWVNMRGEAGPWSVAVSATIAG